jgi:hypothetical protein
MQIILFQIRRFFLLPTIYSNSNMIQICHPVALSLTKLYFNISTISSCLYFWVVALDFMQIDTISLDEMKIDAHTYRYRLSWHNKRHHKDWLQRKIRE